MLSEENKKKIQDFVEYWVKRIKDVDEQGLYYSVGDEKLDKKDFNYPALVGYYGKEFHISHMDLVAETFGFTTKDITRSFVYEEDSNCHVQHFVYIEYKGVNLLSVMELDEYERFVKVLEENGKEKKNEQE